MNELTIRLFDREKDHPMVTEWWSAHGWPPVTLDILPTMGLICCVDEIPACAGWTYVSNSKLAYIEWIVSNPSVPLKKRVKALECLLGALKEESLRFGTMIFTSVSQKSRGLMRLYKKHGFIATDTGMTNMVFTWHCSQR